MKTYVCRWPNGNLSIVAAENEQDAPKELVKEPQCTLEESAAEGIVIELPKGFRLHFELTDTGEFAFQGFPQDALPTLGRLYPHLAALFNTPFNTAEEADAAAAKAVALERRGLKG